MSFHHPESPSPFSAGAGRTGTYMAIDTMMYQLEEREDINIFEYVELMRTRRTQMVQNAVSLCKDRGPPRSLVCALVNFCKRQTITQYTLPTSHFLTSPTLYFPSSITFHILPLCSPSSNSLPSHAPPTLRASTSTSMMPSMTTSTARTPPLWPMS